MDPWLEGACGDNSPGDDTDGGLDDTDGGLLETPRLLGIRRLRELLDGREAGEMIDSEKLLDAPAPLPVPDSFGEAPPTRTDRLELDELMAQLVERAHEVMTTQGRLRSLLRAHRAVAADLSLEVVLRRIAEAACELVDARYGALGVIARDGRMEQFIHVGMDADLVRRIGHLPRGEGVLGLLTADPRPVRLDDIAAHDHAVGFPPGHPPMRTFLGVPIKVRSEVFGNLYLTEKRGGRRFTAQDEELVLALAASAGVAIENARLFGAAQRRQQWLQASADIMRHLLADGAEPLALIVGRAREVADADLACVLLADEVTGELLIEAADGLAADSLVGQVVPTEATLAGRSVADGRPVLVDDATLEPGSSGLGTVGIGPIMVIPLVGTQTRLGAVVLARETGGRPFADTDLDMAATFAGHVQVALGLATSRANRDRLLVLEDRDRIARDLHDHVMQRLYAVALGLQGMAAAEDRAPAAGRLSTYVDDLDATIREIRSTVFELRGRRSSGGAGVRARLVEIVEEIGEALGFSPRLRVDGPLDSVLSGKTVDHLLAVARESLSNVARHARASRAELSVTVGQGWLRAEVTDDGVGLGDTSRRSGLDNLRSRAEELGGTFDIAAGPSGGTRLRWAVPLR
ncbi:histidine kinase [Frankia sp. CcI49]|uniref:GAF domain-containing sensor histidine kinase n=1 Tax=Frankia sp. CcI49 TaxID=1745382 RepID=UPI00097688C0|nr:GAF domain-containing protein [Frankia sp. CcI49]ONH62102.1 histidine kinase [Frankia sp. CcI49]